MGAQLTCQECAPPAPQHTYDPAAHHSILEPSLPAAALGSPWITQYQTKLLFRHLRLSLDTHPVFAENTDKDIGNKSRDQDEDCEEPEWRA